MGKLLIASILFVPFLIARYGAGLKGPRRGFRWTVAAALGFNALYALSLVYLYFKLV